MLNKLKEVSLCNAGQCCFYKFGIFLHPEVNCHHSQASLHLPLEKFFNKKEKLRREPGIDGGISTANRGGNVHKVQLHGEADQTVIELKKRNKAKRLINCQQNVRNYFENQPMSIDSVFSTNAIVAAPMEVKLRRLVIFV